MKTILHIISFCLFAFITPVYASETVQDPVRISIANDLIQDFPIVITASTTGDELRFTFGPKPDGSYCSIDAILNRLDDGRVSIAVSFSDETKVATVDGETMIRTVGFDKLTTTLASGEEDVLFSLGERKFIVKLLTTKP